MTKVVAQVNYTFDFKHADPQEKRIEHAEHVYNVPGMLWKIWLREDQNNRGGGVFLFEDRASAQAWVDARADRKFSEHVKDLTVELFAVDEQLSRITKAPLYSASREEPAHAR